MAKDMAQEVGESKTRKRKTKRNPDSWYKRNAQDFFDGTRELSADESRVYNDVVDLIYIYGGALSMSDRVLAGKCVMDVRKFARIKMHLVDVGKLFLTPDGYLHNERAAEELATRKANSERRSQRAAGQRPARKKGPPGRGASPRHRLEIVSTSYRDRCTERYENHHDINGPDEHMPTYQEIDTEEREEDRQERGLPRKKEEDGSCGRAADDGWEEDAA